VANSKLYDLLGTLNVYELNRLGKFLRSPYFNEDERLVRCYDVLSPVFKAKLKPDGAVANTLDKRLKEKVLKHVYGNGRVNNLKFARLHSDIAKKVDEFLVYDKLRNDEAKRLAETLALYNYRKLDDYFEYTWKIASAKHEKQILRNSGFYLQQFELQSAHYAYLELQNRRSNEKNISETLTALDTFYIIEKLNYLAALLHYKKFLAAEGDVVLANEILNFLKKNPLVEVPAIAINYRIVLSLMEPDKDEHFHELKALLALHGNLFGKNTARNFYAFAINFCIRRINFGKLNYVQELFELYKEMLARELMTDEHGLLSQFDYKNIVTVALRAGDAGWTEKFIREYKNRIPASDKQNAYTFNLARLYFYRKKFDKVLPLLQDVAYTDIFYQLDSKTTLMKTYYELGEYMPLMALKESFRILLRRKKIISEQNRINYMSFIRFTMKLYRLDVKDTKKLRALTASISTSSNVADKGWLLEKLEELTA
jgi:hypothetical protein